MEITITQAANPKMIAVLHVHGNVDSASYEQFQQTAADLIAKGARDMVLDLGQTPYMSSAGLRALNVIYNSLRDENADAQQCERRRRQRHVQIAAFETRRADQARS
jgi:Anti-anti-sigma regulatory factor (antagonist of anti-sigma factor)